MSDQKECLNKIKAILRSKAEIDINYQFTKFKVTYLHMAAGVQGSLELTQLLLLRNPNPNLKDCDGQTAVVRADKFASNATFILLEEYQHKYDRTQKEKEKSSHADSLDSATAADTLNSVAASAEPSAAGTLARLSAAVAPAESSAAGTLAALSAAVAPAESSAAGTLVALSAAVAPAESSAVGMLVDSSVAVAASAPGAASEVRFDQGDSKRQGDCKRQGDSKQQDKALLTAYVKWVAEDFSLDEFSSIALESASSSASPYRAANAELAFGVPSAPSGASKLNPY